MTPVTSLLADDPTWCVLRGMLVMASLSWAWTLEERRNEKRAAAKKLGSNMRAEFNPFLEWLDTPKNLSGQAHAEASGLVRLCSPDNTRRRWVERSGVERLFDDGWRLYEKQRSLRSET
jgi:hypothetical protein